MHIPQNLAILKNLHTRIARNKNVLIVFVGDTGSGKSYACMRLFELYDPSFNIDFCNFDVNNLITNIQENHKPGKAFMFEEAGVGINARNWQSKDNKDVSYIMQTFRSWRLVIGITVPNLSYIDSQSRKLIHYIVETKKIDYERDLSYLKFKTLDFDDFKNKYYKRYIRYFHNDMLKVANPIKLKKPSKELLRLYEIKKDEFVHKVMTRNMDAKKAKEKVKRPIATCKHCGYEFIPMVDAPKKCGMCQKKDPLGKRHTTTTNKLIFPNIS